MEIININEEEWTEHKGLSSTGKRVKAWYERNSDGKIFLYKVPKIFENLNFISFEIWTEIIAYHIGVKLGLQIPETFPAKDKDNYGILVENFLDNYEILYEAKDLLRQYEIERAHNILLIEKFLKELDDSSSFWNQFKKMLIFDCLIGNNDRHDENWGLCFKFNPENNFAKARFAPIYDNASCLAKELTEEGVEELLNNEQKFEKYIKNSRPPNLYWDENDPKRYTHYELITKLIEKEPDTKQIIEEFLQVDYISPIYDIIKEIQELDVPPEYRISDNRAKVIIKILEKRKEKLKELL